MQYRETIHRMSDFYVTYHARLSFVQALQDQKMPDSAVIVRGNMSTGTLSFCETRPKRPSRRFETQSCGRIEPDACTIFPDAGS
jgi:hypothetical protein